MMKTSLIAAMLLLGTASPGLAQQGPSVPQEQAHAAQAGSERVNLVIVYGDDPCPQSQGSDIVVCARKGEEERYRIPEPLRGDPNQPSHQAWGEQIGRASCRERSVSVRVDLGGRRIIKQKSRNNKRSSAHPNTNQPNKIQQT